MIGKLTESWAGRWPEQTTWPWLLHLHKRTDKDRDERIEWLRCSYPYRHAWVSYSIDAFVNIQKRKKIRKDTYGTWLQTDSSRVESDTFANESQRFSWPIWSTFIMTAWHLVRNGSRESKNTYTSRNLAGSEVPLVTERNVRYRYAI